MLTADIVRNGLVFGSILALIGCSFNLILRPTNVLNFAQGVFVMLGAMIGAAVSTILGLPWLVGLLAVLVATAVLGLIEERVAVTPVLKRSMTSGSWIITTLAFTIIVENIVGKVWGATPQLVPTPPGLSMSTFSVGGVAMSSYDIFVVALTLLIVVGLSWFDRTPAGAALSAVAEDREAAMLRGIDPLRLTRWSFAAGAALAGLAGLLVGPLLLASPSLAGSFLFAGFAAAAIGGMGSTLGALIGGYAVALVQSWASAVMNPGYQAVASFALLLIVLMIRPSGIFGRGVVRSV